MWLVGATTVAGRVSFMALSLNWSHFNKRERAAKVCGVGSLFEKWNPCLFNSNQPQKHQTR